MVFRLEWQELQDKLSTAGTQGHSSLNTIMGENKFWTLMG